MYIKLKNENYGYSVATYGDYVAVGNPAILRFNPETASLFRTGSVDFFRYNKNTDQHDLINTLYRGEVTVSVILSSESGSGLVTETGSVFRYRSRWLEIDKDAYTHSIDDGYGISMDMYDKKLVVGSPYNTQLVTTYTASFTGSLSMVEVYNLGLTEYASYTPSSSVKIATLIDPDRLNAEVPSGSFGKAVSINRDWIAVGSPLVSGSKGMVYVFRNRSTGSAYTWSLYQRIETDCAVSDAQFGSDLKLNKDTDGNLRMVVGAGNTFNCEAYYYECITGSWHRTFTFKPDYTVYPLTFGPYLPQEAGPFNVGSNGFGTAVSTYGDAVIVGEPFDRQFHEFSGSTLYEQGSAIIFERCPQEEDIKVYYPSMPNNDIQWTVTATTAVSTFLGVTASNEGYPHAVVKVNNKLYGGGWDGKLFVLNNPDGDLADITTANFIGGTWISQVAYSEGTGYLYFICGNHLGVGTGSIVQVDPNDITDQRVLIQGLPGGVVPPPFGPANLPPLAADNNYLYTVTGGFIYKWDARTGAVVLQVPSAFGMHGGGVFSPDGQWVYFCGGSTVMKINTATLSSSYTQVSYFNGYGFWGASLVDDMAYLNGYLYVAQDQSSADFGLWQIDADAMTWTPYTSDTNWGPPGTGSWAYPTKYGSWGVFTDDVDLYVLQRDEIWIYPLGNLDDGPVRYPITGWPNELWITDGGRFVYTLFDTTKKIYAYELPRYSLLPRPTRFQQVYKTYGDELTLKNNRMGWSVDMFQNNAVVGIPKTDALTCTSCYIGGTLEQLHQCSSDLENLLCGQVALIQKNTSSLDWDLTNVYQKKKKYLSPYRTFGWDVSTADRSMVVGAPIYLYDSNREVNITTTASNNVTIDDISGKAYIYNYANLRDTFHVGNVFYRNGKIVLMTSGSVFDGLFFNPVNSNDYEYDIQFKSQHTIFEKQIVCTVNPGEFNVSTNPTSVVLPTASLDLNQNGKVDFQDIDVILRYMQYKNTSFLGIPLSTNWSSSIVTADDERSLLRWYESNSELAGTDTLYSQSFNKWETTDTWMQTILDLNDDNRIDVRDMNIMWKYFANRLTQANYGAYITPSCQRKLFSDIIDYMDRLTQKTAKPLINPYFLGYESSVALDKTGSYLAPMATTIGLYSGLDLVGVAKLGSPIKITPELPINFVVKMDY